MAPKRRATILGQVRNPLIFFSLVVLVIEGMITVAVTTSKMADPYKFAAICLMVFLVLVVVAAVTMITI